MSKFIDRLNQASKTASQPMGFRTSETGSARTKLLLIASLSLTDNTNKLADYSASADAVLLPVTKSGLPAKTLQKIAGFPSDIPWGGQLEDAGDTEIKPMVEAGCDFVVVPASATPTIPQADKVGKILKLEASISEGLLRAVNALPVDAVFIAGETGKEACLTWHQLMLFRRFADLLNKPMLVPVPLNTTANELQLLWEAGASGVIVTTGAAGQPADKLKELRATIDKLTFSTQKRGTNKALLPRISTEAGMPDEDEEW